MDDQAPGGETPAVRLRDVIAADLPIFFAHQQDPVASTMAAFPARDHDAFMAHWTRILADSTGTIQTIVAGGQVAGHLVCWLHDGKHEVGYWLGQEYWGQGVATQALAAFLAQVPMRPLYATVAQHNTGSRRVLEKCGFTVCDADSTWTAADGTVIPEFILTLPAL